MTPPASAATGFDPTRPMGRWRTGEAARAGPIDDEMRGIHHVDPDSRLTSACHSATARHPQGDGRITRSGHPTVDEGFRRSALARSELFHKCGWSGTSVAASVTDLGDRARPRVTGSPARKGTGELDRRRINVSERRRFPLSDLLWISLWELGRKAQISGKPRVSWLDGCTTISPMSSPFPRASANVDPILHTRTSRPPAHFRLVSP